MLSIEDKKNILEIVKSSCFYQILNCDNCLKSDFCVVGYLVPLIEKDIYGTGEETIIDRNNFANRYKELYGENFIYTDDWKKDIIEQREMGGED